MAKKIVISDNAKDVLNILKESDKVLTFSEIKKIYPKANVSHLGALIRNGNVSKDTQMVVETITRESEKTVYRFEKEIKGE